MRRRQTTTFLILYEARGKESLRNPSKANAQSFKRKGSGLGTGTRNRGLESDETYCILVGEAYVHGIMHGEALLGENQSVETIHVI
jgi:hypothetical protein